MTAPKNRAAPAERKPVYLVVIRQYSQNNGYRVFRTSAKAKACARREVETLKAQYVLKKIDTRLYGATIMRFAADGEFGECVFVVEVYEMEIWL